MKLKLNCKLKLNGATDIFIENSEPGLIAEEITLIELPNDMSDDDIKTYFENFRFEMKKRYLLQLFTFFDVELKELKE